VLSTFVGGYSYIFLTPEGFRFPFGDYFDMDIDSQSHTQVARVKASIGSRPAMFGTRANASGTRWSIESHLK